MFQGKLLAIYLAPKNGIDLHSVDQAEAITGRGLAGDRYFLPEGKSKPEQELTLIEAEALEGLAAESQLALKPNQSRRNLLTRGVPLNHLVGKEFTVGTVKLRGIRLCEPCGHLEKLTVRGIKEGLCHRGGLRAQILQGGVLRVGDAISGLTKGTFAP
jgi:MOSC domain-containing protein YiiM